MTTTFPRATLVAVVAQRMPRDQAERLFASALGAARLPEKPAYTPEEALAISGAMVSVSLDLGDQAFDELFDALEVTLDEVEQELAETEEHEDDEDEDEDEDEITAEDADDDEDEDVVDEAGEDEDEEDEEDEDLEDEDDADVVDEEDEEAAGGLAPATLRAAEDAVPDVGPGAWQAWLIPGGPGTRP